MRDRQTRSLSPGCPDSTAGAVPVPRGSWGMAAAQSSLLAGSPAGAFPGKPKAVDSFLNSPGRNSIVVIQDC